MMLFGGASAHIRTTTVRYLLGWQITVRLS